MTIIRTTSMFAALLIAGMLACSSNSVVAPPTDNGSNTELPCACINPTECTAQLNGNPCLQATCENCVCGSRPLDIDCDDGNPSTVKDHCSTSGVCQGFPSLCGDHICNPATSENCDSCELDCACATGTHCKDTTCVANGICPNAVCEPDENCLICAADCGCGDGKACSDGTCLDCAAYCKATNKECGLSEGCNCGECPQGFQCDMVNHCYGAGVCGNTRCEADENCLNCAPDCPCRSGERCNASGVCEDCKPVCENAGAECGMVEGCTCGSCPTCYSCSLGQKCMADCDCLCYHKECGVIGTCACGTNKGGCPEGEDCNAYKCTDSCDSLCAGVVCGWNPSGPEFECICGFCEGCSACTSGGACVAGAAIDAYENNDTVDSATALGTVTDEDSASKGSLLGTIDRAEDWDFFKLSVTDENFANLDPLIRLTGLAQDKDLDLIACYVCHNGLPDSIIAGSLDPEGSVIEVDMGITNSLCLASINYWGQDEELDLNPKCNGTDDSGTIYMIVLPIVDDDCGSNYTLSWHM